MLPSGWTRVYTACLTGLAIAVMDSKSAKRNKKNLLCFIKSPYLCNGIAYLDIFYEIDKIYRAFIGPALGVGHT